MSFIPMPSRTPVPVNPAILAWAREESGYTVERVAKRLQVKPDKVAGWEAGTIPPTLRQVQNLGNFFQRPLSLFFQPAPPRLPPLAAEYRRLPGVEPGNEPPELRMAVRQMSNRREAAINLMEELGESVPEFTARARLAEPTAQVAARLRAALMVTVDDQLNWLNEYQALNAWRKAVEQLGVLVFQFSKVALESARGLTLLHFPMPALGINSKELPEPRAFTLIHELVHLMLAAANEEEPAIREHRSAEEWGTVERFAEAVAGQTLVPLEALESQLSNYYRPTGWDINSVRQLARRFRVSPLAMATRLREAGELSWEQYRSWRAGWDAYVESLPPRKGGGPDHPVNKAVRRNGVPFTQLVLTALESNRITAVEAARHLDLKFEHFERLRRKLHGGPGALDE